MRLFFIILTMIVRMIVNFASNDAVITVINYPLDDYEVVESVSSSVETGFTFNVADVEKIKHLELHEVDDHHDKYVYDALTVYDGVDEKKVSSIIKDFLESKGIENTVPHQVMTFHNLDISEVYYDDKDDMVFVLRFYSDHYEDKKLIALSCIYVNQSELSTVGYIQPKYDGDKLLSESLYDSDGNMLGEVIYDHDKLKPLRTISNFKYDINDKWFAFDKLNRDQKFWIMNDYITSDREDNASVSGSIGDLFYLNEYEDTLCYLFNDENQLSEIQGTQINEYGYDIENSALDIKFKYNDDVIDSIDYKRPALVYGGSDSSGNILFDNQGRMILNNFYITHGTYYYFYLYDENAMPWAVIEFDSMPYSGWNEDDVEYVHGNSILIDIYDVTVNE